MQIARAERDVRAERERLQLRLQRYAHLRELALFNGQSAISPYADTTVVRSPEQVERGRLASSHNRLLGEEFLLNYRNNNRNLGFTLGIARFYQRDAVLTAVHRELGEDPERLVRLPRPRTLRAALSVVMARRRSVRRFSGAALPLEDLATLLFAAQGVTGALTVGDEYGGGTIPVRATPSGGGLYPVHLVVAAMRIRDLPRGVYRYCPHNHGLEPFGSGSAVEDLAQLAEFGEIDIDRAAAAFLFVYDLYANSRKYGDAGVAFAFIEVGQMIQNVHLAATALGCGSCDVGGFEKPRVERWLGVDGLTRHVIHMTVIGEAASGDGHARP